MSESFWVLQNRFVRAVMLSTLFSQMGIWVRNFAILLYVMEATGGDSFAVSMISVAEYAPIFIRPVRGRSYFSQPYAPPYYRSSHSLPA